MLHWGLLATGVIARKFAATVNAMGPAEQNVLTACAARDEARARAFAAEFDIPKAYGGYEALVNDPEVDIVYISSPNNLHAQHVKLCLQHGKHVLCEKPFTFNAKDAAELYALAAEKGLFLMEALWTYHLPLIHKAQQYIARSQGCSETDAYRQMRKTAMDKRLSMAALAEHILHQAAQNDHIGGAKQLLMQKLGMSEDRAYQHILSHAKKNNCTADEAAKELKAHLERK